MFGATLMWSGISHILILFVTAIAYIPVFYNLQITSIFDYLALRFDERVRKCASFFFAVLIFMFSPINGYLAVIVLSAGKFLLVCKHLRQVQ